MANLNLSQFGEKLFVADADHTFIWDTANAISKRVSRNSWLNSGTLTSDAPVTISQTWNAVGQTFTAFKVNAVSTNSASGSLLADFQLGGATKFKVDKASVATLGISAGTDNSALYFGGANYSISFTRGAANLDFGVGGDNRISFAAFPQIVMAGRGSFAWSDGSVTNTGTVDTIILRDAANTLALRNGGNAQTFNVYGTYTSITDYKRLSLSCSATTGNATIGVPFNSVLAVTGGSATATVATVTFAAQAAAFPVGSSVTVAGITPAGYNATAVVTASTTTSVSYASTVNAAYVSGGTATVSGSANWILQSGGHLLAGTDNTYDIGAIGANRPRNVYVGGQLRIASDLFVSGNTQLAGIFTFGAATPLRLSDGTGSDFSRLQLGGTADTFPAIARDGAGIKFTGAAAGSTSWIKVPPVAVGSLPLAATAGAGARAFVNDASAPVFGTAVAGGGAVAVPVYSTGAAWCVG